ncbi:MAG: UDP-N-acetylmuramate--L-alanine ligase [Wolbachia endosymbiont of Meromenopon meropis]|nr:UDP-N-acetylmuramate--L-alanine ligase [Wolbachia endosymbiont of Meromenopon meropis]
MKNTKKETIHIVGIGGIGMSAIAQILHNSNYKVQGSDIQSNENVNRLQKLGIEIYTGHSANNIERAQIVVYSSAIKLNNVELVAARDKKKVILHRSDILTKIMRDKYVIAVSGSSGKTTTTAMIASIFDSSGIDATVIAGGILNCYRNNSKLGKSNIFLTEVDESDGTMLKIPVNITVITNINNDHVDYYGTFDNIKEAFSLFINKADFAIFPDFLNISCNTYNSMTFGFKNGRIRANNIERYNNGMRFDVLIDNNYKIKNMVLSNAIGIHKVNNALAAISVAVKLGIDDVNIKKGLLEFKGVARRFSLIADVKGIKLIEDYAHHPSEIDATLAAARLITQRKVIGIIELLRFVRIYNFFDEFIKVFMMFDYIILTSVHPPEDEPIYGCGIVDIQRVLISSGFTNVKIMNNALLISKFINDWANSGDIILFIGISENIAKLAKETAVLLYRK